jgi:outer membrane protein assembly factor BamB
MKTFLAGILVPATIALGGVMLIGWWAGAELAAPLEERTPGMDGLPASGPVGPLVSPVPGQPVRSDGKPSDLAGAWPWFRGPHLDAICDAGVPLARKWPPGGPKKLWEVELGQGFASAAIRDGCVYVLDYDEKALADTMRCLSLGDGREIWHNGYPVVVPWNHGMSRTVPAVVGNCVISLGPKCHVTCWDAATGQAQWLLDLVLDYGATVPQWYAGQCPLVDNDRLILAPGGKALLMAVDHKLGKVIWESPNPRRWVMTHSSIVPMEFAGKRMYVYCGKGGVAGVSADDGQILWDTTAWKIDMATCPSPVVVGGGRIFLCGGYNSGAMMLKLNSQGTRIAAEVLFRLTPRQFSSEQQTPVLFNGYLYGVRQADQQLVCLDLKGNEVWSSGREKFGSGPYMIADGLIYVMDDNGRLTMAEATPQGYKRLDRAQVIDAAADSWGPMAMVAGRLIVRDMTRMACLDVSQQ